MSDPTPKPMAFWKLLLIGLVGAGLGKMLADGIMPFQALPFSEWGVARKWVPLLLGWALASLVSIVVDFHGGCKQSAGKLTGKLKSIGPGFARWLAPHLAAAAADLSKESGSPAVSSPGTPPPAIAAPNEPSATAAPAAAAPIESSLPLTPHPAHLAPHA